MNNRQKVFFPILQDEEGYPPFSVERLWAESLGQGNFRIDNIPFYAKDLCSDDIVEARSDDEGNLVFLRAVKESANSTIRVIFYDAEVRKMLLDDLPGLGCDFEAENPDGLVAINVPSSADVNSLLQFLEAQFSSDKLDYEESAPRYLSPSKNQ